MATLVLTVQSAERTPSDLIAAATAWTESHDRFPVRPSLSTDLRDRVADEFCRPTVRHAFELLDAHHRNVDWFKAVDLLESEKAVWSLQACLVHSSEDVQINALRALSRLKNKDAVPFLLIYGDYMAVGVSGSESATIHGIIHESIAEALSSTTSVNIELHGQDPEGLKCGLLRWTKWLVEQRPPAAP